MKRTICSLLLMIAILTGLMQPVLAEEAASELAEITESTEKAIEEMTQSPETTETAQPTEPEAPVETDAGDGGHQTRDPQTYTTSAEGIAFVNEMMGGSYGETEQLAGAERSVNAFIQKYSLSLNQQQFDALVDLVMAYGGTILTSGYRCEKVLASGQYTDVELANAFCAWVKSGDTFSEQRLARRLRELKLFLYGSYSGDCVASFRYVVFNPNGGKLTDNTVLCYDASGTYGTLPTASRDGKEFLGWFTAASGGEEVPASAAVTEDRTVYAQWRDPQTTVSFTDVPSNVWYYGPVTQAVSLGLFNGVSETEFEPNSPTTRAMVVTVLHRLAGTAAASTKAPFTDMEEGRWYVPAVNWAYEKKIVNGISETIFGVNDKITREQLTAMLFRYAGSSGYDTSARSDLAAFSDASKLSNYAVDPMKWAVAAGIVNGDGGNLNPRGNATRAECAKMIVCFRDWLASASAAPKPTPEPPVLKTTEAGVQFIKDHEGFLKYAVWDYSQWSIGYGTRCEKDEFPNGITEEEADYRLRVMLADFEKDVDKLLQKSTVQHTQAQYDAIISFTFNLGKQWMRENYNIYQCIMYGNCTEMQFVNAMGSWINAGGEVLPGLVRRRMDEANLYWNGEYTMGSKTYLRIEYHPAEGYFDQNGSKVTSEYHYYKTGVKLGTLPTPVREGYRFAGWFDKISGGKQYTDLTFAPAYGDMTLYAHWEQEQEEIAPPPVG